MSGFENNCSPKLQEQIKDKKNISQEALQSCQNSSTNMKEIKNKERIDMISSELSKCPILSKSNPEVTFLFSDKNGKKQDMTLNILKQSIEYNGKTIQIQLPNGASITEVIFNNLGVEIKGKLGIFSGGGKANYENLIGVIDQTFNNGSAQIVADNQIIKFNIV